MAGGHNRPFPARDGEALAKALRELGADFRWNVRAMAEEMTWPCLGPPFDGWERTTDRASDRLREEIARRFYYRKADGTPGRLYYGREAWRTSLNAYLQPREVDPVLVWLKALTWDGTPRLDTVLIDMFGAEDCELTRWASRYPLLGPVQRTYEPGCKLDEFVVLISGQGFGKSAFAQCTIPEPMRPDLFSDGLRFDAPPDKQRDAVAGRLIVEVAEMVGRNRAEIEAIKAFVSRQDDGNTRRPYAVNPEPLPRRFVLIGTTNNERDLPNDPTGNRRFVPVVLKHGCNVEAFLDQCRLQLMGRGARPVSRWREGEPAPASHHRTGRPCRTAPGPQRSPGGRGRRTAPGRAIAGPDNGRRTQYGGHRQHIAARRRR